MTLISPCAYIPKTHRETHAEPLKCKEELHKIVRDSQSVINSLRRKWMNDGMITANSLVLYKTHPARVEQAGEKMTLELAGGETLKVRPKDVALLHPGPCKTLAELKPTDGDVRTAWEILAGDSTTLAELAELAFGAFTPATAWATWQLIADGVYFRGDTERVTANTPEAVAHIQAARTADAAEKQAWEAFVARARAGAVATEDRRYLREVEDLALGRTQRSRVLHALGREESPENAHATLLEFNAWDETVNPYPVRLGLNMLPPELPLPDAWRDPASAIAGEPRRDLTALPAYAIDDASTQIPDDALSYEAGRNRLWVHVADPAALVAPQSALDTEARSRALTLHQPEAVVPMLPEVTTPILALGLTEVSPALSFGIDLDAAGQIAGLEIVPSLVRVIRLTYEEVDTRIGEEPFAGLHRIAEVYEARRRAAGAVHIELPETSVRVRDGEVTIQRVLPLASRSLVENAMILAGEAVARYALTHDIPLPFATQDPPDTDERPAGDRLSDMVALRRTMKRSQYRSAAAPHSGLGLAAYAQATSPLRRYLDLVVHQQLRAHLRGEPLLTAADILDRIGEVEATLGNIRQAEHLSNRHWTLVYLRRQPGWRGPAVLVDKRGANGTWIIPALALETGVHLSADLPLDSEAELVLRSVDLSRQDARFRLAS